MKKLICVFMTLTVIFLFVSCQGGEKSIQTDLTAEQQSTDCITTVTVTFPEGHTCAEIAKRLEENGVCKAQDFIDAANDVRMLKTLDYSFLSGITEAKNRPFILEGYIFPDTYEFYIDEDPQEVLLRFLDNTEQKLTEDYYVRANQIGYTMDEILTLASIIQEEASEHEHMPLVSSVLHNRLESEAYGMLQCDVTVNYVTENIAASPYIKADADKATENYDTYERYGLPVGPICNVGVAAIEAALYPEQSNYFFFVTDSDWNYYYAETYEEHQINCEKAGV